MNRPGVVAGIGERVAAAMASLAFTLWAALPPLLCPSLTENLPNGYRSSSACPHHVRNISKMVPAMKVRNRLLAIQDFNRTLGQLVLVVGSSPSAKTH
jgi:hypothetical protein